MKRAIVDLFVFLVLLMLFFPYMGDVGAAVFKMLGKYYYLIVMSICSVCILLKTFFNPKQVMKKIGFKVLLLLALYLVYFLIFYNSTDNILFGVLLFAFFTFSYLAFGDRNLRLVCETSTLVFYVFFVISLIKKCTYFNPNSYAFISTELYLWSIFLLQYLRKKPRIFLFIVNTMIGVVLTYVIYNSATQLICVLGFAFLYLIRKWKFTNTKVFYYSAIFVLFFSLVVFPFIVTAFVDSGVLDVTFFTNRGGRWLQARDAIQSVGFFNVYTKKIGAHNGFLEMCLNYSTFIALLYVLFLFVILVRFYKVYRRDPRAKMLGFMFMIFILMNCTESFFIGLTDSYFLLIVLACIVMRLKPIRLKRRVRVVRRRKVEKLVSQEHCL